MGWRNCWHVLFGCSDGKVRLPPLPDPPEVLKKLLTGSTMMAKQFRANIWQYNGAFMMSSFGSTGGPVHRGVHTTFKVQGQVYHLLGSTLPPSNESPKCAQVYFMNTAIEQTKRRCGLSPSIREETLQQLQEMLHTTNPYVEGFKTALEYMKASSDHKVIISAGRRPGGEHERRYNAPCANEVAIILVDQEHGSRDIVLRHRDEKLQRIHETHRSYDGLQYPLMFPRGEDGYNFAVYHVSPTTGVVQANKRVSCKDFYSYRIMVRQNEFNQLLRFKDVTSQFFTGMQGIF